MQITKPILSRGSQGPEVVYLQTILSLLGYYKGNIDGIFGTQLEHSVKTFQADYGLRIDGIVGVETWSELQSVIESLKKKRIPWWGWMIIGAVSYIITRGIVKTILKHRRR